jgi:hypothetical protein
MDHPSTLDTVHNMSIVFDEQGEYGKALNSLDGREKILAIDHPSTVKMDLVFDEQEEYGEALERYHRALDGKEKALGMNHPDTLNTAHNIGSVLTSKGSMARHLSGTSEPSMAERRRSEWTTQTLSTPWAQFSTTKGSTARHFDDTSEPSMAVRKNSETTLQPANQLPTSRQY